MRWLRVMAAVGALAVVAVVAGCDQATDPSTSVEPDLTISDGAHDGNPRVFFLPPMVPDPSEEFTAGSFVGTLDVVIKVCIWSTGIDACISPVLETYDRNSGPGSETVRVPEGEEYYLVNWHTDEILAQYTLAEGEVFRIVVEVGERIVAFADVEVVATGQELKELRNAESGEAIPLLDGRTLPIKVRVEEGWEAYGAVLVALEAAGYYGFGHTCGLTAVGTAYCWGDNGHGQLGNGTRANSTVPVAVDQSLSGAFASFTTGAGHTCGVTMDGTAYCWGSGSYGQLGNNSGFSSDVPVAVDQTLTGAFTSLTAGSNHTCGVTTDGTAYCWGFGGLGQLGNGIIRGRNYAPVAVDQSLSGAFAGLTAGSVHTCGLTADGTAYCWGWGYNGQLGNGSRENSSVPVPVDQSLSGAFASMAPATNHTCGLSTDGMAYCWGDGFHGELGDGSLARRTVPVAVDQSLTGLFASLAVGWGYTCGLTTQGTAYCWGEGRWGQLGDGVFHTTYPYGVLTPVAVDQTVSGEFVRITAGYRHTCGQTTEGGVYCWGQGSSGQLGTGSTSDLSAPDDPVIEPPGGW